MVTAYWEAYCEDIAAEAVAHIVKHTKSSSLLPEELKKQLAKELKAAPHELEVWKIADRGWEKYLSDRLEQLKEKRNRELNTPKTAQIDDLFFKALGIKTISASWKWKRMSANQAGAKLDKYVTLRDFVFYSPMIADGAGEGLCGQHDGRCVEGCLLARGPFSGRGGTDEGIALDAHDGGDQRLPLGIVER